MKTEFASTDYEDLTLPQRCNAMAEARDIPGKSQTAPLGKGKKLMKTTQTKAIYTAIVRYPKNEIENEYYDAQTIPAAETAAKDNSAVNCYRTVEIVEIATQRTCKGPYPLHREVARDGRLNAEVCPQ